MISGRRRLLCIVAIVAVATGCAEKRVLLEYRFPSGYKASYRWSLQAIRSIESPTEQTTSRLDAVLDLTETVRRGPEGEVILAVRLEPLSVKENGEASVVPPASSAEYEIDTYGRIRRLVQADLSAGAIASLELDALASQIRPPLSRAAVALGGTWQAPLRIRGERTSIDFRGAGRLTGFDLQDKRRLGRVETKRQGTISSRQTLNNAPVQLKGKSVSRTVSRVDLDGGVLFSSVDRSTSDFDVLLSGQPAALLEVKLISRLQLRSRD